MVSWINNQKTIFSVYKEARREAMTSGIRSSLNRIKAQRALGAERGGWGGGPGRDRGRHAPEPALQCVYVHLLRTERLPQRLQLLLLFKQLLLQTVVRLLQSFTESLKHKQTKLIHGKRIKLITCAASSSGAILDSRSGGDWGMRPPPSQCVLCLFGSPLSWLLVPWYVWNQYAKCPSSVEWTKATNNSFCAISP